MTRPITLRQAVQGIGGYTGTMTHHRTGTVHQVDLRRFEGRDLDTTFLYIGMGWVDPDMVGTRGPGLGGQRVYG